MRLEWSCQYTLMLNRQRTKMSLLLCVKPFSARKLRKTRKLRENRSRVSTGLFPVDVFVRTGVGKYHDVETSWIEVLGEENHHLPLPTLRDSCLILRLQACLKDERRTRSPRRSLVECHLLASSSARFGFVFSCFFACFRDFCEVSGTTLRKNLKHNILLLLHPQSSNPSLYNVRTE